MKVEEGFYWDLEVSMCVIYWGWRSKYQPKEYTDRVRSESDQTLCIDSIRVFFSFHFSFFGLAGHWTNAYTTPECQINWISFQWCFKKNCFHHLSYRLKPLKALFDCFCNPGAWVDSLFSVMLLVKRVETLGKSSLAWRRRSQLEWDHIWWCVVAPARYRGSGFHLKMKGVPVPLREGREAGIGAGGMLCCLKAGVGRWIPSPCVSLLCRLFAHAVQFHGNDFSTSFTLGLVQLTMHHQVSWFSQLEVIAPTFALLKSHGSIYLSHPLLLYSHKSKSYPSTWWHSFRRAICPNCSENKLWTQISWVQIPAAALTSYIYHFPICEMGQDLAKTSVNFVSSKHIIIFNLINMYKAHRIYVFCIQ